MNATDLFYTLDLIGTFVFAISGTLSAASKRLDLFGATFIGFVTAIGGGTFRDLLLGVHPVSWMQSFDYLLTILAGIVVTFILRGKVMKLKKTLFLFDTIGIGVFTIFGLQKALMMELLIPFAIIMGMFSAVMGGVIRDTLCNDIPLIFRKEIYATACLLGAMVFLVLDYWGLETTLNNFITIGVIILIRIAAIKFKLTLPTLWLHKNHEGENE